MDSESLSTFTAYLGSVLFSVAFVLESILFYRVGKRLDKAMIVIMLAYLISMFLRLPFLTDDGAASNEATAIATALIVGMIYFFIFEILRLRDKLESASLEFHLNKNKRTKIMMIIVYTIFGLIHVFLAVFLRVMASEAPETVSNNLSLFDFLHVMRSAPRLALDLFMASQFILAFKTLIIKKRKVQDGKLSVFNKRVILAMWIFVAIFIFRYSTQAIAYIVANINFIDFSDPVQFFFQVLTKPVGWSLDFVILLGFLFLFNYQATHPALQPETTSRSSSEQIVPTTNDDE